MNEVKQTMDEVKNFMWDIREGMGIPVIRRKIQRLGLLTQLKEGQEQPPPSTGRQKISRLSENQNTSNSINSPPCGNSDNSNLPSFTSTNLIRNRFQSGTLCPIRTSISNLLEGASETNKMKAQADLLEKQKELEQIEQEKKKSETGFHLR